MLAYWHAPIFSSGPHAPDATMKDTWSILQGGRGHRAERARPIYERFAPQDDKGKADPEHGIRQFTVGVGGGGVYKFGKTAANSEVRDNSTYGVLKLTLGPGRYAWQSGDAWLAVHGYRNRRVRGAEIASIIFLRRASRRSTSGAAH